MLVPEEISWGVEQVVQAVGVCRTRSPDGTLLHKASQEERQQDEAWDGRLMTFVASTGQVDRNGNILDMGGWQLDHYRANPVVLFNHNWDLPPVGKTLQVGTQGDRLMVTIQFAPTPLGRELAILNANRYMGAASVGARMLEWEIRRHPEHGNPIGFHSHRHELLEISVVPVPANPDTLQAALGPSAAPISSGSAHLVGLPPRPGPEGFAFEASAVRFLRALNFGLRGDQ